MNRYLTLSRAARLAGVKRGELQRKISEGELSTFEGMLELKELLRAYPDTKIEDNSMLERAQQIIEEALSKVHKGGSALPAADTLAARVQALSNELAETQGKLEQLQAWVENARAILSKLTDQERRHPLIQELHTLFETETRHNTPASLEQIAARDAFLSIVTAHVRVFPSGRDFFQEGEDSILQAGLRAGLALPYGCSDGSCGQCSARLLSGRVKPVNLTDQAMQTTVQDPGQILMCAHTAMTDISLEVSEAESPQDITTQKLTGIIKRCNTNHNGVAIMDIRMPVSHRLRFLAGQNAQLTLGDTIDGTYPIASCPCEDRILQFHIPDILAHDNGPSLCDQIKIGDPIELSGPLGNFTPMTDSPRPIICIAWNTGFAAIKAIIEHSIATDVAENIHLYWISTTEAGHYMENLCRAWHDALGNFFFNPISVTLENESPNQQIEQTVVELIQSIQETPFALNEHDIYVAAPTAVAQMFETELSRIQFTDNQLFIDTVTD